MSTSQTSGREPEEQKPFPGMTPAKEAVMLHRHGTKPCALTANAICLAAEADIRHKAANAEREERRQALLERRPRPSDKQIAEEIGEPWKYGFLWIHLQDAGTAADLLAAAIHDPKAVEKIARPSVNTLRLYEDVEKLRAAFQIALDRPAGMAS